MDAKTIIHEYEAQRTLEREEWKHAHDEELEHELHHGVMMEEHLRTHVLPILTQAREQVLDCGYPCEIEEGYSAAKPAHLLRLTLQASRHRIPHAKNFSCELSFLGHCDSLICEITTMLDDVTAKQELPIPLEKLTAALIEPLVEKFLQGVFHK